MTITAKIIKDCITRNNTRITTMQLRYPKFIHSEFMTHRVFSRNASSSRAIPVQRLMDDVVRDTAMPVHWGKNQPGMQARENNDAPIVIDGQSYTPAEAWSVARDAALKVAAAFNEAGYHKQVTNRIIEPYSHINVLVTATSYDNFFALRSHPDAQPEIKVLSDAMMSAMSASDPVFLKPGDAYLPFVNDDDDVAAAFKRGARDASEMSMRLGLPVGNVRTLSVLPDRVMQLLFVMSIARCARVSYLTSENKIPTIDEDINTYCKLFYASPPHLSPFEHQAIITNTISDDNFTGNFSGDVIQFRKVIEDYWKGNYGGYSKFIYKRGDELR